MSGVYGFKKENNFKVSLYLGEGHPLALGEKLFKTLFYSWPKEINFLYETRIMKKPAEKPTEFEFKMIMNAFGLAGFNFRKPLEELNFYDLLAERQSDILSYFVAVRHNRLRYMLDGTDSLKSWGVADWAYIYNLDENKIKIYTAKREMPKARTLTDNVNVYLEEGFDLIHEMIHDPGDLGRNQFDMSGLQEAYDKYYNNF